MSHFLKLSINTSRNRGIKVFHMDSNR